MKWLHNLLRGISLTGALFVFQACYGTPQGPFDERGEAYLSFSVVSAETGVPLPGIHILVRQSERMNGWLEYGMTDEDGRAMLRIPYDRNVKGPFVRFQDPTEQLATKDTVFYDLQPREIVIKMSR
jgi:hypothetical protein